MKYFVKRGARVAAAAIIATTVLFGTSAQADPGDVPEQLVKFQGLNPARPADAQQIYTRLRVASRSVCAEQVRGRELRQEMRRRECFASVLDDAVAKVGAPALTRIHEARENIRLADRKRAEQQRS